MVKKHNQRKLSIELINFTTSSESNEIKDENCFQIFYFLNTTQESLKFNPRENLIWFKPS